jgi:hypothetical protein
VVFRGFGEVELIGAVRLHPGRTETGRTRRNTGSMCRRDRRGCTPVGTSGRDLSWVG